MNANNLLSIEETEKYGKIFWILIIFRKREPPIYEFDRNQIFSRKSILINYNFMKILNF